MLHRCSHSVRQAGHQVGAVRDERHRIGSCHRRSSGSGGLLEPCSRVPEIPAVQNFRPPFCVPGLSVDHDSSSSLI